MSKVNRTKSPLFFPLESLETRLDKFSNGLERLETRLEPRSSKFLRIENRVSTIELREPVNLHLSGTVICIKFQVVFFADNFRECATPNEFHEEIFKLYFLLNQGRSIFSKKLVYKDAAFCFVI